MKKQSSDKSSDKKGFGPGLESHQDDKRGTGRTAAHPQLEDEEDEYGSGRLDTDSRRNDIEDYEGDEDIGGKAKLGREDLEDDSQEGASSRQRRNRDEDSEKSGKV